MTLFYAASQHFSAPLSITVQPSGAGDVFTIGGGSLLFADTESLPVGFDVDLMPQLARAQAQGSIEIRNAEGAPPGQPE